MYLVSHFSADVHIIRYFVPDQPEAAADRWLRVRRAHDRDRLRRLLLLLQGQGHRQEQHPM